MPTLTSNPTDRLTRLLRQTKDDPARFMGSILGATPWWRQVEWGESVVNHRDTIIYSGNAIGKDWWVGRLIWWWVCTRPQALVIVIGPGQRTLGSVTWKEVRQAVQHSPFRNLLPARISQAIGATPQFLLLGDRAALAYPATTIERASGQHAANLLVIAEEASGLEPDAWEAIDGLKYQKLIAIGNPLRAEGGFVDRIRQAEADQRDGIPPAQRVHAIRTPSTDSPDAALDVSPRGMADRTWLTAMQRQYGERSLWYASHVLALVPTVSEDRLIPDSWLDYAATTPRLGRVDDPRLAAGRRLGCDLGEGVGRDSTSIIVRDALGILEVFDSPTTGLAEAAEMVRRLAKKWQVPTNQCSYDKLGIGKNFSNHLYRVGIGDARPYAGSGSCRAAHFTNLRTESAWSLRNRLDPDWHPDPRKPQPQPSFSIPPGAWWGRLREDLAALTYDLVGNKTRLIDKDALKDKLGRSPDLGDALIQTFSY